MSPTVLVFIRTKKLKQSSDSADKFEKDHNTIARLAINDNYSKTQFLIDTGADISVMPPCRIAKTMLTPKLLFAANGTKIQTYGEKRITLSLGLGRNFVWTFVLADVNCAIIGADFLQHSPSDFLVDMKRRKLIDRATLHESTCHASQRKINAILSYDTSNQYARYASSRARSNAHHLD
ncbi:uncharacterized protein LOC123257745 [Drosophila ananassae]|uniref:uncharacterized protein LOC123257744 n=1 Tax=Drosophila ananassae TaxID=7217 RepID=UPI001D000413|nr:uncharacterized protein LOC123257744 [Drosophila ananassae]XP_044573617.1 uncharacterized protein LOC123257745 [Drosophila ananassae]